MLQYSDIADLVADNTPAEIAAILQADTRHKRDIMATSSNQAETDLLDLLGSEFGVLRLNSKAEWIGPLVDYFAANPDSPLLAGFELLLTQLQISDRPVRCASIPAIGALTSGITQVVSALYGDAQAVQSAMDAITGGLRYAGVTEADVAACIDAEVARIAAETLVADETRHEVLLSCNRRTGGVMQVMVRVTPVEFADGVQLRKLPAKVLVNDAGLIAALSPIVEGLTQ
jgi:hypothetical protein